MLLEILKKKALPLLIPFLLMISSSVALAAPSSAGLAKCVVITHCAEAKWKVDDTAKALKKAERLISETPRTKIIERTNDYIHAEATTKWMHYVDDLEVKAIENEGILQIRSESRVGIGDNGFNKKRINDLSYRMSTNK